MSNSIYFTADQQRLLRELIDNNLLDALLNNASDGQVQIETEVADADGVNLTAIFEQNYMPVQSNLANTLF